MNWQQMTMKERFHATRLTDPNFYRFMEMWTRIARDRSIQLGLYIVEQRAGLTHKRSDKP